MNVRIITQSGRSKRHPSRITGGGRLFRPGPIARLCVMGFLLLLLVFPLAAQKPIDFVVLLDSSESMFRQSGNRSELVVTEIMKNRLSYQDSFHLLSFAGEPDFEISRVLRDQEQIEDVLTHLMLVQPLEKHSDIVSALRFLTDYISELSLHTDKQILILSDDVHEPGPESLYQDPTDNLDRIESIARYIQRNGLKINIVLIPELEENLANPAGMVQRGLLVKLAELLDIEISVLKDDMDISSLNLLEDSDSSTAIGGADSQTEVGSDSAADGEKPATGASFFRMDNPYFYVVLLIILFLLLFFLIRRLFGSSGSDRVSPSQSADEESLKTLSAGAASARKFDYDALKGAKQRSGERETPYGDYTRESRDSTLPLKSDSRKSASEQKSLFGQKSTTDKKRDALSSTGERRSLSEGAFTLAEFASRDREKKAPALQDFGRPSVKVPTVEKKKTSSTYRAPLEGKPGQVAIEMRVDFQKNKLGRNMRWFDPGAGFSVGEPGVSDFEIHAIDTVGVIATIRREEDNYIFTAEQPEYFSDLRQPVEHCLGRTLRVTSPDTGYTTSIVFKPWISTLERLNRLLHMTEKPGKPDDD